MGIRYSVFGVRSSGRTEHRTPNTAALTLRQLQELLHDLAELRPMLRVGQHQPIMIDDRDGLHPPLFPAVAADILLNQHACFASGRRTFHRLRLPPTPHTANRRHHLSLPLQQSAVPLTRLEP